MSLMLILLIAILRNSAVSYIDFVLVSFLMFIKRIDEREFQKALSLDSAFGILYDACRKWLEKDE